MIVLVGRVSSMPMLIRGINRIQISIQDSVDKDARALQGR